MNHQKVKEMASQMGAEVCGIADIERFSESPEGFHPVDILADAKSVIVLGKPFSKGVFEAKSNAPYTLFRENLKQWVDDIAIKLTLQIEEEGFCAVPIPSAEPYEYWDSNKREGRGILSLKHAAAIAGLGCIGKSTLLLNKEYGNRLWLGAVVTNLELSPDEISENLCPPDCRICLDACPQAALDGITIIQRKCREIAGKSSEGGGSLYACNLCRRECPFSRV